MGIFEDFIHQCAMSCVNAGEKSPQSDERETCDKCDREVGEVWPDHLCGPCYRTRCEEEADERGDREMELQRDEDMGI